MQTNMVIGFMCRSVTVWGISCIFHPTRLFRPTQLLIWMNFPPYTTIPHCTAIRHYIVVSILQTAHLWANTGVVFRELSFSRLECGVHDRLHIYPLCGIFYFPWHRHQIEGTNGFYCLIRKTERFTISNVESQVFTPRIILA